MPHDDKKVKGYKVKKNVRTTQYKEDAKQRAKKIKKTGGFRFGRKAKTGKPRPNIRKMAERSLKSTPKAKNEGAVKRAIQKLSKGGAATPNPKTSGTLGKQVKYKPKR